MSGALARAIREKYPNRQSALAALGLPESLLEEENDMPPVLTSRRALTARGAIIGFLKPVLAADSRYDPTSALIGVTARNFKAKIPEIINAVKKATRGSLAYDADPENLQALLEALGEEDGSDDQVEVNPANPGSQNQEPPLSLDEYLQGKLNAQDHAKAKSLIGDARMRRTRGRAARDQDLGGVEELLDYLSRCGLDDQQLKQAAELFLRENGAAEDEPPSFAGRPRPGGEMDPVRDARILAHDARTRALADGAESFSRLFPRAGAVRVLPCDNPEQRPARIDASAHASFKKMFPNASKIKVL